LSRRATIFEPVAEAEQQMNGTFRGVSAHPWLYEVKFGERRNNNKNRLFPRRQPEGDDDLE
jgi:hypothetical protein